MNISGGNLNKSVSWVITLTASMVFRTIVAIIGSLSIAPTDNVTVFLKPTSVPTASG
jgi:hypothetical protein